MAEYNLKTEIDLINELRDEIIKLQWNLMNVDTNGTLHTISRENRTITLEKVKEMNEFVEKHMLEEY